MSGHPQHPSEHPRAAAARTGDDSPSPRALTELSRARSLVLEQAAPLPAEEVGLERAIGMVLAEQIISAEAVPGFDNSAMDGYALRSADTLGASGAAPRRLRVVAESRAGHPAGRAVGPGEVIAISTGAMLPVGADAVAPLEDARGRGSAIELRAPVGRGSYIRRAGEDVAAGSTALLRGSVIGAFELGVLASIGRAAVPVIRRPTVRVLTTGDELLDARAPLGPGMVRNSNAHTVPTLARLAGAEVLSTRAVSDDPNAVDAAWR